MNASYEVREAARKVAEAALHDMREMNLENFEDGYDLEEDGRGGLWVICGQDVELHVDETGEQDGAYRDPQDKWRNFEPQDGGW